MRFSDLRLARLVVAAIAVAALVGGVGRLLGRRAYSADACPARASRRLCSGTRTSPRRYILGDLYQQALEAKGYKVTLKPNLGSTEIAWKALKSGQIQGYPEYDGTLLATVAGITKNPANAAAAATRDDELGWPSTGSPSRT